MDIQDMQYAFWRRPDGTASTRTEQKHIPLKLLQRYGESSKLNDEGHICWHGLGIDKVERSLFSSLAILRPDKRELNEYDSQLLLHRGLIEEIKEQGPELAIESAKLLRRLDKLTSELFRQPSEERYYVASVSFRAAELLPYNILGTTVECCFRGDFPYPQQLFDHDSYVRSHIEASKYGVIKIRTHENTIHQAFDSGARILDLLCGLLNYLATFRSYSQSWSNVPKRKLLAEVLPGPIRTLHEPNGKVIGDLYEYSEDYFEESPLFKPKGGWDRIKTILQSLLEAIQASRMSNTLVDFFLAYAHALEQSNLEMTFLMLWSLLERITNTSAMGGYEETIDRACWLSLDIPYERSVLNAMRIRRNRLVHASEAAEKKDEYCHILKDFIDRHLQFLLWNPEHFGSIQEYGDFLRLPTNVTTLQSRIAKMKWAIELRCPPDDYSV